MLKLADIMVYYIWLNPNYNKKFAINRYLHPSWVIKTLRKYFFSF